MIQESYHTRLDNIFSKCSAVKAGTVALIGGAGVLFAVGITTAALLPGDLSISNSSIAFDTGAFATVGDSTSITGSSFSAKVGGADTATGFDKTGPLGPGTNPIPGNFTDTGDGFGITVNAQTSHNDLTADPSPSPNDSTLFSLGVDMGFDISNTSGVDTYDVVIKWMFDSSVTASGLDAYSNSEFDLSVGSSNVFTDITADTLLGNEFDGNLITDPSPSDPTDPYIYGGTVTDAGTLLFTLALAPGDMFSIIGAYSLDGEAFEGSTSASFSSFLSIDSVTKHGAAAIPEPTTMLLFGVGLAGLTAVQRRKNRS